MSLSTYVIRGGIEGRERLRLLARILRPTTLALFDRIAVRPGMACLDVGCGGGDVSLELARLVGSSGRVVGIDLDETKLEMARNEATTLGFANTEFRPAGVIDMNIGTTFDLVYARFVLSHLADPAAALDAMRQVVRPGGVLAVEDVDFAGHFWHPECPALERYVDLYTRTVRGRGGDPNLGPRLPGMLVDVECADVSVSVAQPAGFDGEIKLVNAVTMENIADAVVAAGLGSRATVDAIVAELYSFARNPYTLSSIARVVQAWGRIGCIEQDASHGKSI